MWLRSYPKATFTRAHFSVGIRCKRYFIEHSSAVENMLNCSHGVYAGKYCVNDCFIL